ncbi:unnamed protein product [Lathyrus oleraceus]
MMKIKHAIFLCLCAMLLISIVAIEPYEHENQFGEIEKPMRNIDGVVIRLTNGEGRGRNEPLFPDCEKDGGSEGGNCGGHEVEEGVTENAIPIPNGVRQSDWWTRKAPVEKIPVEN